MPMKKLTQAAQSLKPEFDPSLHNKIMRGVQQARIDQLIHQQSSWQHHPYRLATSAAALLAIGLTIYSLVGQDKPEPAQFTPLIASLRESAQPINQQFTQPIQNATRQISLMQEDVADFGRFVTDQFNVLPKEQPATNKPI